MNEYFDGATIWARKTIESDIFFWKPAEWFKIWFYIVSKVNHKDTKQFKRGEGFFNFENEKKQICVSDDQIKKCLQYLRRLGMIDTRRSTRGNIITVLNYALYQDLNTYKSTRPSTREAREKHERSTPIDKYVKYEKNDITNVIDKSDVFAKRYGNADVNTVLARLSELSPTGKLDGTDTDNRRMAHNLIRLYTLKVVLQSISNIPGSFYEGRITSARKLKNSLNALLVSETKGGIASI